MGWLCGCLKGDFVGDGSVETVTAVNAQASAENIVAVMWAGDRVFGE